MVLEGAVIPRVMQRHPGIFRTIFSGDQGSLKEMDAYLFLKQPSGLEKIPLKGEEITIGRLPENEVTLQDGKVSRRHCKIHQQNDVVRIQDLNSSNGTVVNKRPVDECNLREGDQIILGDSVLYFSQNEQGPENIGTENQLSTDSSFVKQLDEIPDDYRMDFQESIQEESSWTENDNQTVAESITEDPTEKGDKDRFLLLYQLGKTINTRMDLEDVLRVTVESIRDVFSPRRCVILISDEESGELIPRVAWERDRGFVDENEVEISWTIASRAIDEKVSVFAADAPSDPRFNKGRSIIDYNIRSAMCVPLWEQDDVFGVIYVDDDDEGQSFHDEDLDLLTAIGNQVAIRIKQEKLFEELKQEAVIRQNFERFHSPDIAEKILEQSREGKEIQQELQEEILSVLFVDIEKFTNIADVLDPLEVADILNKFYDSMSEIIFDRKGGVNKYIGDNVMAIFGAPIETEDHADQAVTAGAEMIRAAKNLNDELPEHIQFRVRVGINSGQVVHGYVGSREVKEFTVIGDPVNVAARLEEQADPNTMLIGQKTNSLLNNHTETRKFGSFSVRARQDDVIAYRVPVD